MEQGVVESDGQCDQRPSPRVVAERSGSQPASNDEGGALLGKKIKDQREKNPGTVAEEIHCLSHGQTELERQRLASDNHHGIYRLMHGFAPHKRPHAKSQESQNNSREATANHLRQDIGSHQIFELKMPTEQVLRHGPNAYNCQHDRQHPKYFRNYRLAEERATKRCEQPGSRGYDSADHHRNCESDLNVLVRQFKPLHDRGTNATLDSRFRKAHNDQRDAV